MILTDLHVHTSPWLNGPGAFRSFVRTAIQRDIAILGLIEHGPPADPNSRYRGLHLDEIENHIRSIEEVKEEFREFIQVFYGLELDYHPNSLETYRSLREEYPFDYFFAAVHSLDDWYLDDPESLKTSVHSKKTEEELYRLYYSQIAEAAKSGIFDGLAHIDYLRRSVPHPPSEPPDFSREIFAEISEIIAANKMVVEANTRGRVIPEMREVYPTRPLMKCLARAGVRFSMGSDAHEEARLGEGLKEARGILREENQEALTYFKRHQVWEVEL